MNDRNKTRVAMATYAAALFAHLLVPSSHAALTNVEINTDETFTTSQQIGINVFIGSGDLGPTGATGSVTAFGEGVVIGSTATTQIGSFSLDRGSLNLREGAQYHSGQEISVGLSGHGAVSVESGARVDNGGFSTTLGLDSSGQGALTVTGDNSNFTAGGLLAGRFGTGTVTVAEGGTVRVANGSGTLVLARDSSATATVNIGTGGRSGNLQVLAIQGGAGRSSVVFDHSDEVRFFPELRGNLDLTKRGTGRLALPRHNSFTGTTEVNGGELALFPGFTLSQTNATVGESASDNGTVNLSGANSAWTTSNLLVVGDRGTGTLHAELGATVSASSATVGSERGSVGTVTVIGSTSRMDVTDRLLVGDAQGSNGHVRIEAGASLSARTANIGVAGDADGRITVKGNGSRWTGSTYVGVGGSGTIEVQSGATFESRRVSLGSGSAGTARLEVSGANSSFRAQTGLVGERSAGDLEIKDGGIGVLDDLRIGDGGSGAVRISGQGAQLSVAAEFIAGFSTRSTLEISNGGKLVSRAATVTHETSSVAQIDVAGTDSVWTLTNQSLNLGRRGHGALNIQNGGRVSAGDLIIGEQGPGTGEVSVTGAGSILTSSGKSLLVGKQGHGELYVRDGGTTRAAILIAGEDAGGSAEIVVEGNGSQLLVTEGGAAIGRSGAASLTVRDNAKLETLAVAIGARNGGSGTLTVSNGGSVSIPRRGIEVALERHSLGVINIGDYDRQSTAGILDTPRIVFGAGSGTINFNQTDDIVFLPAINGNGRVVLRGSGRTTFGGDNAYTGETFVEEGYLAIDGDQRSAQGNVVVDAGGLLGGTGVVGGDAFIEARGGLDLESDDLVFASDLLLGEESFVQFGADDSPARIEGLLTLEADVTLRLDGWLPQEGRHAFLSYGEEGVEGLENLSTWSVAGADPDFSYEFGAGNGEVFLTATPVPEPRALLILGLLVVWFIHYRIRRAGCVS